MKVSVCTVGTSPPWMAMISNWPRPFTLKICSVMIAPPKICGRPSAMTVATGINETGNFYDIDPEKLAELMAITRELGSDIG